MTSPRTKTSICNLALDVLKDIPLTDVATDDTPESRWLLRNYDDVLDAELREHVWKFAVGNRRLYPHDFILRGRAGTRHGTLSGAWGMVRMIQSWSGDLVTLRRPDGTTDDIGFDTDVRFDLDTGAASTFLSGGDGTVAALFDQSGNGRSLVQATSTKQPAFDQSEDESGRPAAVFDGSNDLLATAGNMSDLISTATGWIVLAGMVDALTLDSATVTANHFLAGDLSQNIGLYARKGGNLYGRNNDGAADAVLEAIPIGVPFVATLRHEGGSLYVSVDGRDEVSGASGATSSLASLFQIGDIAGSNATPLSLFAALAFSTPPAEEERKRIVERLMRWVKAGGAGRTEWAHRYPAPDDCLRMLPLREGGRFEGSLIAHEIEDMDILTNQGSYVDARYIRRVTDPTRFDPSFVQAFAGRLAMKMAHAVTGKQGMIQTAAAFYADALSAARKANALEGTPERAAGNRVIDARGAGWRR